MMRIITSGNNFRGGNSGSAAAEPGGGSLVVTGVGFGSGPTVTHYETFSDDTDGQTIGTSADVGTWDTGNVTGTTFGTLSTFDGRKAFGQYGSATTTKAHGMRRASMTPYSKFLQFFKAGIPTGKNFPGDIAEGDSWSGSPSSCKFVWHTDNNDWRSGGNENADIVTPTHVGGGDFTNAGNSIKGRQSNDTWMKNWGSWNNTITIFDDDSPSTGYVETLGFSDSAQREFRSITGIDCFETSVGYGGSISARQFNSFEYSAWSGNNGGSTNIELMFGAYYLATGANSHKYLLVGNNSSLDSCTDVDVLAPVTWSDTEITADIPADATNFTHYFVMSRNTIIQQGAI